MSAVARVQVTLDISIGDSWGDECTIEQVLKQAKESAISSLRRGLIVEGLANAGSKPDAVARIVGEPKVTAILYEQT